MRGSTGDKEWNLINNEISFGGMIPGTNPLVLDRGVAFKIKKWEVTDWFGFGDDFEYGQSVWGEETVYFKLDPTEDDTLYKTDIVTPPLTPPLPAFIPLIPGPDDQLLRDSSVHRHIVLLKNANNFDNFYLSFWLYGGFYFRLPPDTLTPAVKSQAFESKFYMQYNVPYVISFYYRIQDNFTPVPASTIINFRIFSFGVDLVDANIPLYDDTAFGPPNALGPILYFNLGYSSAIYTGKFVYVRPNGTQSSQSTPMLRNVWYHFTVEYYRVMGTKNIQIRYLKDGV